MSFDKPGTKLPKIFHVNWFRKGADGKFLWPGFGDNLRVLEWIIDRCDGKVGALETPIGLLPTKRDLDLEGLAIDDRALDELIEVDAAGWRAEVADIGTYLESFGSHMPAALKAERKRIADAFDNAASVPRSARA